MRINIMTNILYFILVILTIIVVLVINGVYFYFMTDSKTMLLSMLLNANALIVVAFISHIYTF
jgi:uridylate kinase